MRLNNLLKIGLLATVFLMLAATPVFAHVTWTSPAQHQEFGLGNTVTARAKTDHSACSYAVFTWSKTGAGGGTKRTSDHLPVPVDTFVSDTCTPDETGTWKVRVDFYDSGNGRVDHDEVVFDVVAVPEFPFGVPIILLFACSIYVIMRRRLE